MTKEQIMVELFEFSAPTYYKWSKHEKRKIFDLLSYAFNDEELIEFINTSKIKKIEDMSNLSNILIIVDEFYEKLCNIKDEDLAKKILILIKELNANRFELEMSEVIELIYAQDNEFYSTNDSAKIKYEISELLKENQFILSYICSKK